MKGHKVWSSDIYPVLSFTIQRCHSPEGHLDKLGSGTVRSPQPVVWLS
jgi:hypothetical protein